MTVYPKAFILPIKDKLQQEGITMVPSHNPNYYTIISWDKSIFSIARKVKLYLFNRYQLKPLSLRDSGLVVSYN